VLALELQLPNFRLFEGGVGAWSRRVRDRIEAEVVWIESLSEFAPPFDVCAIYSPISFVVLWKLSIPLLPMPLTSYT
jgi:hypothetical protein